MLLSEKPGHADRLSIKASVSDETLNLVVWCFWG
jgi:hypothetical protein